ncbi:hypothetical protein [Pseudomonas sp. RT6P73]
MHTKAQLAVADILVACRALDDFGKQAMSILAQGAPYPLDDRDRVELKRAIDIFRHTLGTIDPFISYTIRQANYLTPQPTLPFL